MSFAKKLGSKVFDDILLKGIRAGQAPARTQAARDWYRRAAADVVSSKVTENKILRQASQDRLKSPEQFQMGSMYMFSYFAKHRESLPYFDQFPLIFPYKRVPGGFMGINLHYLPHTLRAQLMDALYDVANNKKYDETTKLQFNYKVLNNAAQFKAFKPCIKHYLNSQVKSRFIYVYPSEWDLALFLPTENFSGASKRKVWADSRKMIT